MRDLAGQIGNLARQLFNLLAAQLRNHREPMMRLGQRKHMMLSQHAPQSVRRINERLNTKPTPPAPERDVRNTKKRAGFRDTKELSHSKLYFFHGGIRKPARFSLQYIGIAKSLHALMNQYNRKSRGNCAEAINNLPIT